MIRILYKSTATLFLLFLSFGSVVALNNRTSQKGKPPTTKKQTPVTKEKQMRLTVIGADRPERIKAILNKSSLRMQISQFCNASYAFLLQNEYLHSADTVDLLKKAIRRCFGADSVLHYCTRFTNVYISPENTESKKVAEWTRSPLGKKVFTAEMNSLDTVAQKRQMDYMKRLNADDSIVQARARVVHRLLIAMDMIKNTRNLTATFLRMEMIQTQFLVDTSRVKYSNIDSTVASTTAQMAEDLDLALVSEYLFFYRDLSITELLRVAAFYESPDGRWFVRYMQKAMEDALAKCSENYEIALGIRMAKSNEVSANEKMQTAHSTFIASSIELPNWATAKKKEYRDGSGKINISLPEQWYSRISESDTLVALYISPEKTVLDNDSYTVGVAVTKRFNLSKQYPAVKSDDDIIKLWMASLEDDGKNYAENHVEKTEPIEAKAYKGLLQVSRFRIDDASYPIRMYQLVLAHEDNLVIVTMDAPEGEFHNYSDCFEEAIRSLKLTEAPDKK